LLKKIPHKEIVEFTRVLSLLLYAKISIVQAFELIYKQTKNEKLKEILKNILKGIKSGTSLSKSFAKYPDVFADIFIANLKVGEETGEIALLNMNIPAIGCAKKILLKKLVVHQIINGKRKS